MDAVIYCRISSDQGRDSVGVSRQEVDCRVVARRLGLRVAAVLVDNDFNAYSGVHRPGYAALVELVTEGRVQAVIAWHPDRLHRSLRELEEFITLVDTANIEVHTVAAGDVDLSTPVGRMVARQLGTFARYESGHRSERVKAAHRDLARRGRYGGGARPYGYDQVRDQAGRAVGDGTLVVVPDEAKLIREAARRVIAGETASAVCSDFNARGYTTSTGGRWHIDTLRNMLVSPRLVGLRVHHGEVVGRALWPPILTDQQHQLLRQRLDRRRTHQQRAGHHLLAERRLHGGMIGAASLTCASAGGTGGTTREVRLRSQIRREQPSDRGVGTCQSRY